MTFYKNNNKIVPINNPNLIIPKKRIILLDNNTNQTISMLAPIKTSLRFIELNTPNLPKVKLQPKFHTTSPKATKSKYFNKSLSTSPKASQKSESNISIKKKWNNLSKVKLQPKFHTTSPKATKSKYFNKSLSTSPKASQKSESNISIKKKWNKLSFKQIDTIKTLMAPYYSTHDLTLILLGLEYQKL